MDPAIAIVTIVGWMVDPVVCACITMGLLQVDVTALVEISELVTPAIKPAHFHSEQGVAREEGNDASHHADTGLWPAIEPGVRTRRLEGLDNAERRKAVSTLAWILMQAAGLMVEELSDDRH